MTEFVYGPHRIPTEQHERYDKHNLVEASHSNGTSTIPLVARQWLNCYTKRSGTSRHSRRIWTTAAQLLCFKLGDFKAPRPDMTPAGTMCLESQPDCFCATVSEYFFEHLNNVVKPVDGIIVQDNSVWWLSLGVGLRTPARSRPNNDLIKSGWCGHGCAQLISGLGRLLKYTRLGVPEKNPGSDGLYPDEG